MARLNPIFRGLAGMIALCSSLVALGQECFADLCQYRIAADRPAFHVTRWSTRPDATPGEFTMEFLLPFDTQDLSFGGVARGNIGTPLAFEFQAQSATIQIQLDDYSGRLADVVMSLTGPDGSEILGGLRSTADPLEHVVLPTEGRYALTIQSPDDDVEGRIGVRLLGLEGNLFGVTRVKGELDRSASGAFFAIFGGIPAFTLQAPEPLDVSVTQIDLLGERTQYFPAEGGPPAISAPSAVVENVPGTLGRPPLAQISGDGQTYALGDTAFSSATGEVLHMLDPETLIGNSGRRASLVFDDDGFVTGIRLVSASEDITFPTPERRAVVLFDANPTLSHAVTVSRADPGTQGEHRIDILDLATGTWRRIDQYQSNVRDARLVSISPDGQTVAYIQMPRADAPRLVTYAVADQKLEGRRLVFPTFLDNGRTEPQKFTLANNGIVGFTAVETLPPQVHRVVLTYSIATDDWRIVDRFGVSDPGLSYTLKISDEGDRVIYQRQGRTFPDETPQAVAITRELVARQVDGSDEQVVFRGRVRDFYLRDPDPFDDLESFAASGNGKSIVLVVRQETEPEGFTPGSIAYQARVFLDP